MIKYFSGYFGVFCVFLFLSCIQAPHLSRQKDSFLWLEEVEGEKALSWVKKQNKKTLGELTRGERFKDMKSSALKILQAKDKIPDISLHGSHVYNFWQDDQSVRGVWRRTSVKSFRQKKPKWETLLDIDALAKKEKENWVYQRWNSLCLPPGMRHCLISLSRGGRDASVIREFDTLKKRFVKKGFYLPEAKSFMTWLDRDHVLVGTDFGEGSLTDSGYPRLLKLWKRGTDLKEASMVFEAGKTDMIVKAHNFRHLKDQVTVVSRRDSFFTAFHWLYENGVLKSLPLQKTAGIVSFFHGSLIVSLKEPWSVAGQSFPQGSLVAVDKAVAGKREIPKDQIQLLYIPDEKSAVDRHTVTKDRLLIGVLEDVRGKIFQVTLSRKTSEKTSPAGALSQKKFSQARHMDLIPGANLNLFAASPDSPDFFISRENFLEPQTLYFYNSRKSKIAKSKTLPARFDNRNIVVFQKWVTSRDGTRVPYFLVGKKSQIEKGNAPTLLFGYGGFEISVTPKYNGFLGQAWLEKGGLYAVANIRGGGEFGPRWHRAAQKMNRHLAYDDFIAVAEDLIKTGITIKDKLAIYGGSNGGLLVGAVMTRRPDLFRAVVCRVPLLDMIRYSKLLAGASWVGEYGDPEDKKMRDYLLSYSPYHNVRKDRKYPELFLLTSTKDDRVHPGHARKMAARMIHLGHQNLRYYENIEGGHGAAANLNQKARMDALIFEFLFKTIGGDLKTTESP